MAICEQCHEEITEPTDVQLTELGEDGEGFAPNTFGRIMRVCGDLCVGLLETKYGATHAVEIV